MVEQRGLDVSGDGIEFRLRPNRSISRRGLAICFVLLASASFAVAGVSAAQGNVFAPFFALFELTLVGICLGLVSHALERTEVISVAPLAVVVRAGAAAGETRFDPYWVRLRTDAARASGRRRLLLASHGRELEIGSFLGDDERARLARSLDAALAAVRQRTGATGDSETAA